MRFSMRISESRNRGRFSWTDGQMIQATSGKVLSDANWMASDYTDISDFDFIEIKVRKIHVLILRELRTVVDFLKSINKWGKVLCNHHSLLAKLI